jgi:hypothetical protein
MDAFAQVLEAYRTNYLEYKVTGNAANKTAYENAQIWLTQYLGSLNKQVQDSASYINGFVSDYARANPEIQKYTKDLANVRKEGPKLQDKYETSRLLDQEKEITPDWTAYYVKAVITAGLVGVVAVLSLV